MKITVQTNSQSLEELVRDQYWSEVVSKVVAESEYSKTETQILFRNKTWSTVYVETILDDATTNSFPLEDWDPMWIVKRPWRVKLIAVSPVDLDVLFM